MRASAIVAAVASGVLAGVFVRSAAGKLRARATTRAAMTDLGLPGSTGDTLAIVEGFTALGLVVERSTPWSAIVAGVMLAVFTIWLGLRVARGDRRPCPCFGAAVEGAVTSTRTLARNGVLLGLSVVASAPRDDAWWIASCCAAVVVGAGYLGLGLGRGRRRRA